MAETPNRRLVVLAVLLILALAAGLRFFRLDAQSFWNDEGNSARIAERSVRLILEGAAGDIHPPLYYLALHYWRALAGQSEFALRAFSAVGGVGLVALTFALGDRLFGRAAGLAAALSAAVNPFQVYYSQEARSYIWVAVLATAAVYCAIRLWQSPQLSWRWSLGYVLVLAVGLYTHYLFLIVLVPINLAALLWLAPRRKARPWWHWVLLHAAAGVLYLPWAPVAFRHITGWPSAGGEVALVPALLDTFRLLGLGQTIDPAGANLALLGFGLLLLLGLAPAIKDQEPHNKNLAWVALWLSVPVALVFALDLFKPAFLKFMLVTSPPFCLLLGRGTARFLAGSRARAPLLLPVALSLGLVVSFSYDSLHNLYSDPQYARPDYRGMAAHIQSAGRPGDAVVLNAANQWEVFTYYYPHVERVYPLPRSRPVNEAQVIAELEQITAAHDRIFAIFWGEVESDPQRLVERWLDAHAYKAADAWWGEVRLVTYAVPAAPATEIATPLEVHFGDRIALHGYTLLANQLAPGDIIQITLFWEALEPVEQRYKVFLHLLDHDGRVVSQRDSEPGGGLALTTTWRPGQLQMDNHGVSVPADTPAGVYQLVAGMYPLEDPSNRLPLTSSGEPAGDLLQLPVITITMP